VARSVPLLPIGHSATTDGVCFLSSFERPNSFVMTKRRSRFEPRLNTVGDVVSIVLHISIAGVVGVVENVQATRAGVLRTQSVLMGCTRACSCERCIPSLLASSTLAEEGGLGGIGYGTSGDHVQLERPQNAKRSDGLHESFVLAGKEGAKPPSSRSEQRERVGRGYSTRTSCKIR